MAIERRTIGSSIGAGNFGSRGTPLGYNAQTKGPDLSRLLNSIGNLTQVVKEDNQEAEQKAATEAEFATRKAIFDNMAPKAGETDEQRRQRVDAAVSQVRQTYSERDRGLASKLFQTEDLALRAVDQVQTKSRTHLIKNQITSLRRQNPHMSTAEFMSKVDGMMEEGFSSLDHIEKEDKIAFLKEVNSHALNEITVMSEIGRKNFIDNSLQELDSVSFESAIEELGSTTQVSVDEANDSIDNFRLFQENFTANSEVLLPTFANNLKDVYNKALAITGGDKRKAQDQALTYAVTVAKTSNTPEILDYLSETKIDGSGTKLTRFYSKQILAAREGIERKVIETRDYLTRKEERRVIEGNKRQLNEMFMEHQQLLNTVSTDPHNFDSLTTANNSLKNQREQVMSDFNSGKYQGNEAQAGNVLRMVEATQKVLDAEEGDYDAVTAFRVGMFNEEWTIADHNKYASRLTRADAAKSLEMIRPQLESRDESIRANMAFKAFKRKEALNRPGFNFLQNYDTWLQDNKTRVEAFGDPNLAPEAFKALGQKFNMMDASELKNRMQAELNEVGLELTATTWEKEQRPPTVQEFHESSKGVIEKYDKYLKLKQEEFKEYNKFFEKASEIQEKTQPDSPMNKSLEKASANPWFRATKLEPEDVSNVYEAARLGTATPDQVKVALIEDLRHNQESKKFNRPSDVIEFVADRYTFDVTDESSMRFMGEVLGTAFKDTLSREGAKKGSLKMGVVERADKGVDGRTYGEALGDLFVKETLFSEKGVRQFLDDYTFGLTKGMKDSEVQRIKEVLEKTRARALGTK